MARHPISWLQRPLDAQREWAPRVYHVPAWNGWGDHKKLAALREIAEAYGRDPALRDFVIRSVIAGVANRDYPAQARAILAWVQGHIRYVNEPNEQIQSPKYTMEHGHGDCLPGDTLLLTSQHELIPLAELRPGAKIWGKDRWSDVLDVWEKGPLEVLSVKLNNGSTFKATADHKVYVNACERHGLHCHHSLPICKARTEIRVALSELEPGDVLVQPERIAFADGGLGDNPIYRLGVRAPQALAEKRLAVKSITRTGETAPCYDLSTDDHYVYLPEADVTVSNCDDLAVLVGSFATSIALPWKFALAGKDHKGQPYRWIERSKGGRPPWRARFFHIYVVLGWPPFKPSTWASAEPTVQGAPLGYDVVLHGHGRDGNGAPTLPELAGYGAIDYGATDDPLLQNSVFVRGLHMIPWRTILLGVIQGVISGVILRMLLKQYERTHR